MRKRLLLCLFLPVFFGCQRKYPNAEKDTLSKDSLIRLGPERNRKAVQGESKSIDEFVSLHQFHMNRTGTGLRYEIYKAGTGKIPEQHSVVTFSFKVTLLDGTLCYAQPDSVPQKSQLGRGELINGLEEAFVLMNEGSQARLVIPAHLAYSVAGDERKIPPNTPLFYDLKLIKVD